MSKKDHLMGDMCLELEIFQFEVDEEGKFSGISVTWPFPLSVVENVTDEVTNDPRD